MPGSETLLLVIFLANRFRHLAMRLHPDKCALPTADEAFKRVNEAYQLLVPDGKV